MPVWPAVDWEGPRRHTPGRRGALTASWLFITTLPVGCFDASAPVGTQVNCTSDDQCPDKWVCSSRIDKCVRIQDVDDDPPALEPGGSVAPALAIVGMELVASFTASEDLALDPVVVLHELHPGVHSL